MIGITETPKTAISQDEGSNVCAEACQNGAGVVIHGSPYTVSVEGSRVVIEQYIDNPSPPSPDQMNEAGWL